MTENERLNNAIIAAIEERDRLRAERDALAALLREARPYIGQDCDTAYDLDLYDRIDAALAGDKP